MSYSKKILLVEGETDKSFFNRLCQNLSLDTHVQVAPPKDVGGKFNTKQGVINHLEVLLPQLEDGQITNIGIVVDADYIEHGTGTEKTLELVSSIVKDFDYKLEQYLPHKKKKGLYFKHSDGLADLGLWIMPDNKQEGMLEDWIKTCISTDEKILFENARSAVQQLATPKFKNHLQTKAEIATWLAWQKSPGHGVYTVIDNALLDEKNEIYQALCKWLNSTFRT